MTVFLMFCERYLEYQLHPTMRNHHPQELGGKVSIEMQIYSNEGAGSVYSVLAWPLPIKYSQLADSFSGPWGTYQI